MSTKIKLPRRLPSEEPEIIEVVPSSTKAPKIPAVPSDDEIEVIGWEEKGPRRNGSTLKPALPPIPSDDEEIMDVSPKKHKAPARKSPPNKFKSSASWADDDPSEIFSRNNRTSPQRLSQEPRLPPIPSDDEEVVDISPKKHKAPRNNSSDTNKVYSTSWDDEDLGDIFSRKPKTSPRRLSQAPRLPPIPSDDEEVEVLPKKHKASRKSSTSKSGASSAPWDDEDYGEELAKREKISLVKLQDKAKRPPIPMDEEEAAAGKEKTSRKRLTEEEKAARKAAKEEEAARKKQQIQEQKAAKQAAKDLEKALKKSAQEAKKQEAPGNAVKLMTILIPDVVAAKFDGVCAFLTASEVKYEMVPNPILDNVITFRRDVIHRTLGDDMQFQNVIRLEDEDNVILLMHPEEYIPKISDQLQQKPDTMITYVEELQSLFIDKKITLFFMDFEKYVRKQKKNTNQDFRNLVLNDGVDNAPARKKPKKPELPSISLYELNGAIVELQLMTHANYRVIKDAQELGLQLFQFAKAIAEAPHKRKKMEDGFDWYALSDSGNIRVDKDGNGLKALWIDQLMQFNTVGIDTAQAIAKRYPSPRSLLLAYENCEDLDESLRLLQDIPVRLGVGPLARTRKVGPELSKRIYRFFNCTTGDRCLGSSHDT